MCAELNAYIRADRIKGKPVRRHWLEQYFVLENQISEICRGYGSQADGKTKNNTPKKLTKAAAIVSLAAALAATPVGAAGIVAADEDSAYAYAYGSDAEAYVELSFERVGVTLRDIDNESENPNNIAEAELFASHYYQYGDLVSTAAIAWANGHMVGHERWARS